MIQVFNLAFPFFGVIVLGFLAGKRASLPVSGLAWLDFFVLYITLPALFFDVISNANVEELSEGRFIFAILLSTFSTFLIAFALGLLFAQGDVRLATLQGLVGSYANVGYMGPALVLAALGPAAAAPTALIFCFDVTLVFTILPIMMALGGDEKQAVPAMIFLVLRRVLTHPFIVATLLGFLVALSGIDMPEALRKTVSFLRQAAAPAALFALGVTVALQPLGRRSAEIPVLIIVKLVIHPLMAWLVLTGIGDFDPLWIKTAVLMACLPPAATIFVAARQYGIYTQRAAMSVLLGTASSIFTVTFVLWLVTQDKIPIRPWEWG